MTIKYAVRFSYAKYQSSRLFDTYEEALNYGNTVLNWRGGNFMIQSRRVA